MSSSARVDAVSATRMSVLGFGVPSDDTSCASASRIVTKYRVS